MGQTLAPIRPAEELALSALRQARADPERLFTVERAPGRADQMFIYYTVMAQGRECARMAYVTVTDDRWRVTGVSYGWPVS